MKYFKLFENFISESLNEAMSFDEIKDKYLENPYGIGAQTVEYVEGERGNPNRLVFRHDNKRDRDRIEAYLKSIGIPAKKLSRSKADKAYKYPYEVTLFESEAFDINEAYKHKFEIGDYVKFGKEKARIDNVYTSSSGKAMYTIGSGKHGAIDVEAQDVDAKN